jgi:hypothetical protein
MRKKLFRVLMQLLGYLPKYPSEPYCLKKQWTIRSFESLKLHNCIHKGKHGLPCKNLIWLRYQGERAINLQLLRFMGWTNSQIIVRIDAEIRQLWLPESDRIIRVIK